MPKRSTVDWALEGLCLLAVTLLIGIVALHWSELPLQVPKHFGISGKQQPKLINLPFAVDRMNSEVMRLLQSMVITLKFLILCILTYLEWSQIDTALGRINGLGMLFLPISLLATFILLRLYLQKLRRFQT